MPLLFRLKFVGDLSNTPAFFLTSKNPVISLCLNQTVTMYTCKYTAAFFE
jgi:hypothetical protein